MFDFTAVLPEGLLNRAFKARNGEPAWNCTDAIDAITLIERAGFKVLGVEVWVPSSKGPIIPMPFFYAWDQVQVISGNIRITSAGDFVRKFRWDERRLENFKHSEPVSHFASGRCSGGGVSAFAYFSQPAHACGGSNSPCSVGSLKAGVSWRSPRPAMA